MSSRDSDTGIGGPSGKFPETQHSAIRNLRDSSENARKHALESVIRVYWKPVYKHLRLKWRKSNEDAKDLTQAFFVRAMEKEFFAAYEPARARFRTFLRTCLDGFVSNEEKAFRALKRGGDIRFVPMDFGHAEIELSGQATSPDECFDREWTRSLFTTAFEQFSAMCHETGRTIHLRLFEMYDIDPDPDLKPSYASLAGQFGIAVTDVTNNLSWARREFRKIVLLKVREVTGSEEEFRSESRRLLGAKVP